MLLLQCQLRNISLVSQLHVEHVHRFRFVRSAPVISNCVRLDAQRAQSKMMLVSKRIFATTLILIFCDVTLAASASNIDNYAMLSPRKEKEAEFVVEYYKDHEISEKQARENLRNMRDDDFITPAHCKACKAEHRKYCHSENLLKDHCCCNQSHNKGKFTDLVIIDRFDSKGLII